MWRLTWWESQGKGVVGHEARALGLCAQKDSTGKPGEEATLVGSHGLGFSSIELCVCGRRHLIQMSVILKVGWVMGAQSSAKLNSNRCGQLIYLMGFLLKSLA